MKSCEPNVPETGSAHTKHSHGGVNTCYQWGHPFPVASLDANLVADMNEDLLVAHTHECKLAKIGMSGKVLQGVELRVQRSGRQ